MTPQEKQEKINNFKTELVYFVSNWKHILFKYTIGYAFLHIVNVWVLMLLYAIPLKLLYQWFVLERFSFMPILSSETLIGLMIFLRIMLPNEYEKLKLIVKDEHTNTIKIRASLKLILKIIFKPYSLLLLGFLFKIMYC